MKLDALLTFLADEFSGLRAKNAVADISRFHRIQASPGYDDAVRYLVSQLNSVGVASEVSSYVADGRTETYGWIAPPGWRIRSGSLYQIEPTNKRLGSFDIVTISVLGQSASGDAEGDLVHVGAGDSEACFKGLDLNGKFVLCSGRPAVMLKHLKGSGAVGLIIYPPVDRAEPSHDLVQYAGFFPRADELEWLPMGFSISRRDADLLLKDLAKGVVRVHGRVDAEFLENPMQVLEARIEGSNPKAQEVLLTAHLCHPGPSANDNASGSGVLLEIARVLSQLAAKGELANTVRLLWIPEFNGAVPWAAEHADDLQNVLFSINLDMVGQSPEIIGEPLRVFRVPNSQPSFLNAFFEPLLAMIAEDSRFLAAQGSRRVLHWILDAPSGGSDHLVFQAAPVNVPSVMLGHDDPYWHTDLDTLEKVDPTRLKCVGVLTAVLALLPTWGPVAPGILAEWLHAFSHRALASASQLARSTDGAMRKLLLDIALRIETGRAEALSRFLGIENWPQSLHLSALQEGYRALMASWEEVGPIDDDLSSSAMPKRNRLGPLASSVLVPQLLKEERDFLNETLSSHHGAPPQLLLNLADGSRTTAEITAHLSLDFQKILDASDIARAIELLEKAGYLVSGT
jgi:aminopeptidase YwaD